MDPNSPEIDATFVDDYINSYKRKLLKISNAIVSLESKYINAKKSVIETINTIKDEIIGELDFIYQKKHNTFLGFYEEVENHISKVLNAYHSSCHLSDIVKVIEDSPDDLRLLPYTILNFVSEDISIAKSAIGYIKTYTVFPEELILQNSLSGSTNLFEIQTNKPWYSLLIYSLAVFAKDSTSSKSYGSVIDKKDGSYAITFHHEFNSDFTVSVTLYGRHITNSPLTIKISSSKDSQKDSHFLENTCSQLENTHIQTLVLKQFEISHKVFGKDWNDYICGIQHSGNAEKRSSEDTGKELYLTVKEEALKKDLVVRGGSYFPTEGSEKENIGMAEQLKVNSYDIGELWYPECTKTKANGNTTEDISKLFKSDSGRVLFPEYNKSLNSLEPKSIWKPDTSDNNQYWLSGFTEKKVCVKENSKKEIMVSSVTKNKDEFWLSKKQTESKNYKDMNANSLINTAEQNKSNKIIGTPKGNSMIDSRCGNGFWTQGKERSNHSNTTETPTNKMNSTYLSSHESNEKKTQDSMTKISNLNTSESDGFWSPQTTECVSSSSHNSSACKNLQYFEDEQSDEEQIIPITAKLTYVISKQCGVDLNFPIGVVNSNSDIVICDTGNHRVWIVNETGKRKAIFNTAGESRKLRRPSAVARFQNGDLIIKDNSCLHLYDSNGIFIRSIGDQSLSRPFGLVLTDDEKLVTLCETRQPRLFIFNKDGKLEDSAVYEPLLNRSQNSKCRFMATFHGELIVSDLGLSKMYKTTLLGENICTFGSYGKTPGKFNQPSGITLDPNGAMLIGDSKNDRIQIFDWNGEYLGGVHFSEPIRRPSDITLTSDGFLFVLNYLDHFLGVYKLEMDE